MTAGKILHTTAGRKLTQAEYEADASHSIGGVADLSIVRTADYVVAASDSSATAKAQSDEGYVGDGTADDVQIKAALALAGDGIVFCQKGTYYLASKVTINGSSADKYLRLVFAPGSYIVPSADVDMFELGLCGALTGGLIWTGGIPYTSNVVTFSYAAAKLYDIEIAGNLATGTGVGILMNTTAARAITYNHIDDIKISGFEYGIKPAPTGACLGAWLNIFTRIRGIQCTHFIYENKGTSDMHRNIYEFDYQAFGTASDVDMLRLEATGDEVRGSAFDFAGTTAITLTTNCNGARMIMGGVTAFKTLMSDSGSRNVLIDNYPGIAYQRIGAPVQHLATSPNTFTEYHAGGVYSNLGASDAVVVNLPQTVTAGVAFEFVVMVAQQFRIDPGAAGAIYINGAKQADDAYIWADAIGESVKLVADGNGDWIAVGTVGTWTVV